MMKSVKSNPVHLCMGIVFVVGLVISGFRFLDAREMALVLARMKWWLTVPLLLLPAAFLWLKAVRFADLFVVTGTPPRAGRERSLTKLSYAGAQLATLLPGGYVARIALMESALKRGAKAVPPTLLEKILDLGLLLLIGIAACFFLPSAERYVAPLVSILLMVSVLSASKSFRTTLKKLLSTILSRFMKPELVKQALTCQVPNFRQMVLLGFQTCGVLMIELLILAGSFYALGLEANWVVVILSYAVADLIGRLAPTPGGIGFTEAGMVTFLHQFDGMGLNQAAAATFLFRFLLFVVPALYGSLVYYFLWAPKVYGGNELNQVARSANFCEARSYS